MCFGLFRLQTSDFRLQINDKKLLDIGCATGDFLLEAKDVGFDCEGIELSTWAAESARRKSLVIYQESLENFSDKHSMEYDIVCLFGVIEHFIDPAAEVVRIQKILKPNGLFLIWTGDVNSITSRLLGQKWWYWQGQHIQYFTYKSLKKLLVSNGFQVVTRKIYPYAVSYETICNSLKRYSLHRMLAAVVRPFFLLKPVWYLYLPGEMFIIARKI